MGSAIKKALDMIATRKAQYKAAGVLYYRPWVFDITHGEPHGEPDELLQQAAKRVHDEKEASVWPSLPSEWNTPTWPGSTSL